jgi:3-hydroxyisobutyrate dehydrogenase-like beta-hydroxyacid dehydrogenase
LRRAHNEQIFNRHKPVLDAMGDQPAYIGPIVYRSDRLSVRSSIGPIGAGTTARLVHNGTSAVMGVALAQ